MLPSVLMWSDAGPDSDMKTGGMCVYAGDDNAGIMDGLLHRCFRESWVCPEEFLSLQRFLNRGD